MRRSTSLSEIMKHGGKRDGSREEIGDASDAFDYSFLTDDANVYARRLGVSKMLARGMNYSDIAEKTELTYAVVSTDARKIIEYWYEEIRENASHYVAYEMQVLSRVQTEAWDAWEKSKDDITTQEVSSGERGKTQKVQKKSSSGDARFLQIVMKCSEDRRKLLGLDQPERIRMLHEVTHENEFEAMTEAQRKERLADLMDKLESAEVARCDELKG